MLCGDINPLLPYPRRSWRRFREERDGLDLEPRIPSLGDLLWGERDGDLERLPLRAGERDRRPN